MAVVRIAHVSDLHISTKHRRSNIRRARILLQHLVSLRFDHVVVTGDLTADAAPDEYQVARNLFTAFGLLDATRLTVVPGNHDVFGGVHQAEDLLSFPARCRTADLPEKLELFHTTFGETFTRCLLPVDKGVYPFAKVIGDVALIGVNSVMPWSRAKNPFGSNGRVGDGQLARLRELLTSPLLAGKRKVVLIHHHFRKPPRRVRGSMQGVWAAMEGQTMKLRGKGELRRLFAGTGVEAVLHGHLHEMGIDERDGIRYLNAGGSVVGSNTDVLSYHGVTIDAGGVRVETGKIEVGQERGRVGVPLAVHTAA